MTQRERANVRNDAELRRAIDAVDADHIVATNVGSHQRDQHVRGLADERHIDRPTDAEDRTWQTFGKRRDPSGLWIDGGAGGMFWF